MWRRLAVAAIALTYVICVLLMSGVQKDDWSAGVFEELQRRNGNVSIEGNDKEIPEKCRNISNVVTKATPLPSTWETMTTERNSYEERRRMPLPLNRSNETTTQSTQNIHKPENDKANHENSTKIVFENFIHLYWKMLSKSETQDSTQTTIVTASTTTTPIGFNNDNHNTYKNLEQINSMLLRYFAAELTTTTIQPTTEITTIQQLHIDLISQKIKELLEGHNKSVTKPTSETTTASVEAKLTLSIASNFDKGYPKLNEDLRKYYNKDSRLKHNEIKTGGIPETDKKTETKAISDDVIKEITEKIKASVLKELQSHLNSSKLIETTTTALMISSSPTTTSKRDTTVSTNVLDNIIELLKQLKEERELAPKNNYTLPQRKDSRNEFHGPINVLYPPLLPLNYEYDIKNESLSATPILAYPYHHFSIVNNPVLLKNNFPVQAPETQNKDMLTNFNLGPAHHGNIIPPSDAGLVPPLVMPNTMNPVGQNIIVSTKRPMMHLKDHNYKETKKHQEENKSEIDFFYDMIRNNRKKHIPGRYLHREDATDKKAKFIPRNRQYNNYDDYYKMLNNLNKDEQSLDRVPNRDRFHEILEKPDRWQRIVSNEKEPKGLMVSSRQQTSLHDFKRPMKKYDSHFKDFLQSQKKVNDMLERLLATKSGADNIPSVEVP